MTTAHGFLDGLMLGALVLLSPGCSTVPVTETHHYTAVNPASLRGPRFDPRRECPQDCVFSEREKICFCGGS